MPSIHSYHIRLIVDTRRSISTLSVARRSLFRPYLRQTQVTPNFDGVRGLPKALRRSGALIPRGPATPFVRSEISWHGIWHAYLLGDARQKSLAHDGMVWYGMVFYSIFTPMPNIQCHES